MIPVQFRLLHAELIHRKIHEAQRQRIRAVGGSTQYGPWSATVSLMAT
jgi:hypothetical protein